MAKGPSPDALLTGLRVEPGDAADLVRRNPAARLGLVEKAAGQTRGHELQDVLDSLHNRLWAEARRSVILVLQGMDASGKDGTIRRVLTGLNPQGCSVVNFKEPTTLDVAHDYLWRIHAMCPVRGELAIFNRSHYEDVVTVRVRKLAPAHVWRRRHEHVRAFEKLLIDEGTTVVKVFLHLSRDEQRARLQERLDNPEKRWKFQAGDLEDRALWNEFALAYEETIGATSTEWAPWYVVPADHNWSRNLAVAEILVAALERLDPKLPEPDPAIRDLQIS